MSRLYERVDVDSLGDTRRCHVETLKAYLGSLVLGSVVLYLDTKVVR